MPSADVRKAGMSPKGEPDYAKLFAFRKALRSFLKWSDDLAREVGLTGQQHQLLLAIRGHDDPPTIGVLADDLMLRHHSAVELINRAEQADLVVRDRSSDDRREVYIGLTRKGQAVLRKLSEQHVLEIRRLAPVVKELVDR